MNRLPWRDYGLFDAGFNRITPTLKKDAYWNGKTRGKRNKTTEENASDTNHPKRK
jgi:hypothetical protein